MNPVPFNEEAVKQRRKVFLLTRSLAVSHYVDLEQAWCACLAHFGEMSNKTAATIFFKISASRSRSEILDNLKRHKIGANYSVFWNSAIKEGALLADQRNEVVHWMVAMTLFEHDKWGDHADWVLRPPNYWGWSEDTKEYDWSALALFASRCIYLGGCLDKFPKHLRGELKGAEGDTWREIFQQQLAYPPPPDHPLYQRTIEPLPPP